MLFGAGIVLFYERAAARGRSAGWLSLWRNALLLGVGIVVLRALFDPSDLNRSWLVLFIVAVWAVQLLWSHEWLSRFRYEPFEWIWRSGTYRRWQPLRGGAA